MAAIRSEFRDADLGDVRRTMRLQSLAEKAMKKPAVGFPEMVSSEAELEGLYRFFSNEAIDADEIVAPHMEATFSRGVAAKTCVVIHDTTELRFGGASTRRDLGRLNREHGQGFFAHVSLAVAFDEARTPLGVCGLRRLNRMTTRVAENQTKAERHRAPDRESLRWEQQIRQVHERCDGQFECIHVADRESDIASVLALLVALGARFVIRAHHNRALLGEEQSLLDRVGQLVSVGTREVLLSPRHDVGRPGSQRKQHPARDARIATLSVAGCSLNLRHGKSGESIPINVVRVWEQSPRDGESAIEWILFTSEPIETAAQMFRVVDLYRCRWIIEEFFKALKTGCSIEKRQLESFHALANALSFFLPIAWKLLLARSRFRADHKTPATALVTPIQLQILAAELALSQPITTAFEATLAIAKLGGHLTRNGFPGWQTLGRGFEKLLVMEVGWRAAMQSLTTQCEQSDQ